MHASPALNSNNGLAKPQLSPPPPDITQPVEVVVRSQSLSTEKLPGSTDSDNQQNEKIRFQLSAPPPDVIQSVIPVTVPISELATAHTVGKENAPEQPAAEKIENVSLKLSDYTMLIGSEPDLPSIPSQSPEAIPLDFQEMYQIIREVAVADSGETPYTAVSANLESLIHNQPAQQRQFGLGFGLVLFTQASGLLGQLLTVMQRRDTDQFSQLFGPQTSELLAVTTASTEEARLKPIGGNVLWSDEWIARFQKSGAIPTFQAAQNETAIEYLFRPMLPIAHNLGLVSDRALAMVFDRVVIQGLGGGLRWILQSAGPLRTQMQRENALQLLGFKDLLSFQQTISWIPKADQNGQFNPTTHAALVGNLRELGAVFISQNEMMDRLLASSSGAAKQRLERLRHSDRFTDIVYRLK